MCANSVKKIVLAVHGIGDQVQNSTILSTAVRFCDYFGYPGVVPLGRFKGSLAATGEAVVMRAPPERTGFTDEIGFAEVYWADVARDLAEKPYTLQETTAWVRSVVNRVRVMAAKNDPTDAGIDYPRIRLVLEEMVQAIRVFDSLLFVAKKAGLMDFNLRKVLDDFLGDVQLVTEFTPDRRKILDRFHTALTGFDLNHPTAEIYIVAHSEGTVVTFLALLEACTQPEKYPWISRVRGLMTLGSPLDKHLILWPELFESFRGPGTFSAGKPRIRWMNYADNGDPVGFELDSTRLWLERTGYNDVFKFDSKNDYDFTRYYMPGKAHVDYWNDSAVFNHFIESVVASNPASPPDLPPPPSRPTAVIVSWFTGYILAIGIAALGVYILYKTVGSYLGSASTPENQFVRNIAGLTSLLVGTTVWARVGQLSVAARWFWGGALLYTSCAYLSWLLLKDTVGTDTGVLRWFETLPWAASFDSRFNLWIGSLALVVVIYVINSRFLRNLLRDRTHDLTPRATVGSSSTGESRPKHIPKDRNTLRLMIRIGAAALLATAVVFEQTSSASPGSLWPVLLAGGVFLYLWWLATLVFDLVFIWHRYIRGSGASEFLRAPKKTAGK